MTWQMLDTVFRLESPLHIGYRQIGTLAKTRYYVPGKNIWAAVTVRLAQMTSNGDLPDYRRIGKILAENVRFSYFFLSNNPEDVNADYSPKYQETGLMWGNLSQDDFERRFITSFVTTAINHESRMAEDESLHEIELISHQTVEKKPGDSKPVYGAALMLNELWLQARERDLR